MSQSDFENSSPANADAAEAGGVPPQQQAATRTLATAVAEHLPGWSAQPRSVATEDRLDELRDRCWGWRALRLALSEPPHHAFDLTGPGGEKIAAVRTKPGSPLIIGALLPDDAPGYVLATVPAPGPVVIPAEAAVPQIATEVKDVLSPRYQRAIWLFRSESALHALEAIEEHSAARIWPPGDPRGRLGKTGSFHLRRRAQPLRLALHRPAD